LSSHRPIDDGQQLLARRAGLGWSAREEFAEEPLDPLLHRDVAIEHAERIEERVPAYHDAEDVAIGDSRRAARHEREQRVGAASRWATSTGSPAQRRVRAASTEPANPNRSTVSGRMTAWNARPASATSDPWSRKALARATAWMSENESPSAMSGSV
jgi:hypothetical protein